VTHTDAKFKSKGSMEQEPELENFKKPAMKLDMMQRLELNKDCESGIILEGTSLMLYT